jgi:hypothetical protein
MASNSNPNSDAQDMAVNKRSGEDIEGMGDQGNVRQESPQMSQKGGKRSSAKKAASSRYDFGPIPATSPVAGAFGRGGRRRSSDEPSSQMMKQGGRQTPEE